MKRIYALKERWVLIGEVISEGPSHIELEHAAVIRRWGTTKGLGEIALNGPTENTVLDACGRVSISRESVLFALHCK